MKTYYGRPSDKREIEEKRDKQEATALAEMYDDLLKHSRSLDADERKALYPDIWELCE